MTYLHPRNTQAVTLLSLLRDARYFSYMREHHERTFLPRWCVRIGPLSCATYVITPDAISTRLGLYRIDSANKRHIAKFLMCTQVSPHSALALVRCEGGCRAM